jgi:hypothetical protein
MCFQFAPARPVVRFIVVVDVAEQEAGRGAVNNQPQIETDPGGPEVAVFGLIDSVQLKARLSRVHLKIERGRFDGLLLFSRQAGKAVGECVGNTEVHLSSRCLRDLGHSVQQCKSNTGLANWFADCHGMTLSFNYAKISIHSPDEDTRLSCRFHEISVHAKPLRGLGGAGDRDA